MRRGFSRRRRGRTMWFGESWNYSIGGGAPVDYCYFHGSILPPSQMFTLAPHGYTIKRIILDWMPFVFIAGSPSATGATYNLDAFLTVEDAVDDAGTNILVTGSDILKPFVQPVVGSANIGAARSYMWTKRVQVNWNQSAGGGAYQQWAPTVQVASTPLTAAVPYVNFIGYGTPNGGNPYLDLRVKRRVQPGQALVFGIHYANGVSSTVTDSGYANCRVLVGF